MFSSTGEFVQDRPQKSSSRERAGDEAETEASVDRPSKKAQIISLFSTGVTEVDELSRLTESRPSYVASVLQDAGRLNGYFDLYTPTARPVNAYSKEFIGKLGFGDLASAEESVDLLASAYDRFHRERDRAGQHHALALALAMFNRARWCGKRQEADLFRHWINARLFEPDEEALS